MVTIVLPSEQRTSEGGHDGWNVFWWCPPPYNPGSIRNLGKCTSFERGSGHGLRGGVGHDTGSLESRDGV